MKAMEPPFLPYIGVNLADLIFIEEGTPDLVGDLCNFQKASAIATSIRDFMTCQECPYNFTPSPHLQKYPSPTSLIAFTFPLLLTHLTSSFFFLPPRLPLSLLSRYIQEFKGFNEDDSYAVSQEVEPRSSLATSNPSSPSSPTTPRKNAEALIGEIHAAVPSPPQQLLSSAHKIMREDEGDVPFLDLRGTVCVKLQVRYNTPYYKQHNILQQKLYIFSLSNPFFLSFF